MSATTPKTGIRRRGLLGGLVAAAAGLALGGGPPARALPAAAEKPAERAARKKPIWIGHF